MKARAGFVVSAVVAILVLEFAGAVPTSAMPRTMPVGPVHIYDVDDLQNMSKDLNGTYELANDIDASATADWNGGSGFKPIDDFRGVLEGAGHTITQLYINRPSTGGVGLFCYVNHSAKISNVTMANAEVHGADLVGCLAGSNAGTIFNCSVTGSVDGFGWVGGIAGSNDNCYTGNKTESAIAFIINSRFNGSVNGSNAIGGLAGGMAPYGEISSSYSIGKVQGRYHVGGLVGENLRTDIQSISPRIVDCYSLVEVNFSDKFGGRIDGPIGGLVGMSNSTIINSYSAGPVRGGNYVGGLVGIVYQDPIISGCYWDNITSGQSSSSAGAGRDTAAMTRKATFAGWDFNATWDIVEGKSYPFLRAHPEPFYRMVTHPPTWSNVPADAVLNAGDSYAFAASATDVDPGDTVTYGLTGTTQLPDGMSIGTSTGIINWPAAILGNYYLSLTASDGKNTIRHYFNLTVVEGAPSADNNTVIVSPANNSDVSGVVNITARVRTCNCTGITQLLVDGAFIRNGTPYENPQWEYEWFYHLWNSSTVQDGRHKITVLGKHPQYSGTIYVIVKNSAPVPVMPVIMAIEGPINTRVNATESVTFHADAVNPDGGQLSYDWKENGVTLATGPTFTKKFPPGNHTLVLNIGDGLHYVNRTISFVVSPKPKPAEPEPSIPGFGAAAVVAAIAGVFAAGLFWRRERR